MEGLDLDWNTVARECNCLIPSPHAVVIAFRFLYKLYTTGRWSLLHSGKDSTALWEGFNCTLRGRIPLHSGKDSTALREGFQCMLGRISLSDVELIKFNEQDVR